MTTPSKGDKAVLLTCIAAGIWLIGVEMGEATPHTVHYIAHCPDTEQGEKLISITIDGGKTHCRYQPAPYGRITKAKESKNV